MQVIVFKTAKEFRKWLVKHHDTDQEVWLGFYNKKSGKTSISYKEAVDEALCFGWIDGIRKGVDKELYTNRFTPRRQKSNWSLANIKRVGELTAEARMHPAGIKAFEARSAERSGVYSFEKEAQSLPPAFEKQFKANKKAWKFFVSQAPWYQRTAIHLVTSAKQEATKLKRLQTLIGDSEAGRTISQLTRKKAQ